MQGEGGSAGGGEAACQGAVLREVAPRAGVMTVQASDLTTRFIRGSSRAQHRRSAETLSGDARA